MAFDVKYRLEEEVLKIECNFANTTLIIIYSITNKTSESKIVPKKKYYHESYHVINYHTLLN